MGLFQDGDAHVIDTAQRQLLPMVVTAEDDQVGADLARDEAQRKRRVTREGFENDVREAAQQRFDYAIRDGWRSEGKSIRITPASDTVAQTWIFPVPAGELLFPRTTEVRVSIVDGALVATKR